MQKMKIKHPYIVSDERICGGSPVIKNTRTRISDIVIEYKYLGYSPDDIVNAHPHLTLQQVHDAISYYYENKKEIDKKIKKDKEFVEELCSKLSLEG